MAHFLTPLLDKFTTDLNEAVATAQANIFAELAGLSAATKAAAPTSHPRSKAKAKRARARK